MSKFQFKEKAQKVNNLCQETIKTLESYEDDKIKALLIDFQKFFKDYQLQTKLTIAFIGQYNAGKSTLIKALTGDPTVKISADVCTDSITEYAWHDVLLIDTPGIYAGKTEHDEITLDRISRCDLLVFMVSNELFNPQGGEFFKKVCEMQRVGQMLLVVNKMSRADELPQDLIKSILEVIEPYHPNDFYTCFIDANSYLDSQLEQDQQEKEFLIEDSNFDDFLSSIEKLINRNKLSAKLATPLHRAIDTLDQARNLLSTEDPTTRNLLELLRRKVLKFKASQTKFQNNYQAILNDLEHEIIMLGDAVASKVDGEHTEDDVNSEIRKAEQQIEILSSSTTQRQQFQIQKVANNTDISN
jgi:GTPase Era involved in 16S rRNA processing